MPIELRLLSVRLAKGLDLQDIYGDVWRGIDIEAGITVPSKNELVSIAYRLGINLDELESA